MADMGDEVGDGIKRFIQQRISDIFREWIREHFSKKPERAEDCFATLDDPQLAQLVTETLREQGIRYDLQRQSLSVGADGQIHERSVILMELLDRPFLDCYLDAFAALPASVAAAPLTFSTEPIPLLYGGGLFLAVWLVWLRYSVFIGNFRAGEEAGSARWGTRKEGEAFKDPDDPDNNVLFTEHFGLAMSRKKFDGSGAGKTRYYVKPNLLQLNASYFATDPKGTLIEEVGGMFAEPTNGYVLNSIDIDVFDYRQREGLNSVLPLGYNHVDVSRYSTTAEVTMLMPFATQELNDEGGNYCGQNKQSRNLVFCNRKLLSSPMGFVCGKTGSGKGMFVKTEIAVFCAHLPVTAYVEGVHSLAVAFEHLHERCALKNCVAVVLLCAATLDAGLAPLILCIRPVIVVGVVGDLVGLYDPVHEAEHAVWLVNAAVDRPLHRLCRVRHFLHHLRE